VLAYHQPYATIDVSGFGVTDEAHAVPGSAARAVRVPPADEAPRPGASRSSRTPGGPGRD
ncbi:MAG: hypothetical protein OXH75_04255, partial [Acidobacteria bacterium]|nr:hypothetical protein [Acidobacteriota bacterium]